MNYLLQVLVLMHTVQEWKYHIYLQARNVYFDSTTPFPNLNIITEFGRYTATELERFIKLKTQDYRAGR